MNHFRNTVAQAVLGSALAVASWAADAAPVINSVLTSYSATGVPTGITVFGSGLCASSNCSPKPALTLGGVTLTGVTISSSGYTAYVDFANVVFNASVTARCALIYNVTQGNKSIAVLDFGSDKTSTNFTITMPADTATAALIRSSN